MPAIDRAFNDVQLYTNFNKEVTGVTKLANSILFSNLDPTGATNIAIEFAKIYSWYTRTFTYTSGTDTFKLQSSVLPDGHDTTYQFREGTTTAGTFEVKEGSSAWQAISIYKALTEDNLQIVKGSTDDSIKLQVFKSNAWTDLSTVTLGLLDSNSKIKETYLPSYVDDVIEAYYDNGDFYTDPTTHTAQTKITPESGKIYVDLVTNDSYRWGGTTYVKISNPTDVFTGATSSVAGTAGLVPAPAAGDQGKFLKGDGTWATVSITDNKVQQILNTDTTGKSYPLLFSYYETSNSTGTPTTQTVSRKNTVYVTPHTGTITATTFVGSLTGNADTATKLGTADVGSVTQGIYLEDGVPTAMTYTLEKSVPSNAIFTDEQVKNTVGTANTYYPAGRTGTSTGTGTQVFDTSFKFTGSTGSTSAVGKAELTLGNSTASGTAGNKQGSLVIYGSTAYKHTISGAPTADRALTLPNKGGTIALTSDILSYTLSGTTYDTNNTAQIVTLTPSSGSATTATISAMTGADGTNAGKAGLAPKPTATDNVKYLKGAGTWGDPVEDFRAAVNDETYTLVLHCTNGRTSS